MTASADERLKYLPTKIKKHRYERKLAKAKAAARSELDSFGWSKHCFSTRSFLVCSRDCVERINYDEVSEEEFIRRFEEPAIPVVIEGATRTWPAEKRWCPESFLDTYREEKFKVGEDDDGDPVYLPVKYFMHYALVSGEAAKDDSPLYIFDSTFGERKYNNSGRSKRRQKKQKSKRALEGEDWDSERKESQPTCKLLEDYEVPKYFRDDLFRLCGERRRPPYRWMVVGPARSGTGIHVDPLGTSAWNAIVYGHKRWVLFPPGTPRDIIEPAHVPDHEAASWFAHVYPSMEARTSDGKTLGERLGMREIIQKPGETVFVPGGWHHVVINCDFTIAVTQNFCSRTNLETVWLHTRYSRPRLAKKFTTRLEELSSSSEFYARLRERIRTLETVPAVPPDSSSSSGSSSSSSSGSDDTLSESTDMDGNCLCRSCKRKRKKPLPR
ncbi:uncharacterized protein SPPG_05938 [Spizellomyces punctatus DAOM BR117]|uniref:JmjC domain-containing protein n=1 Tax=Spizellomyces punctatus (strain DAOM BR117) TaxID=645134 RepID=A0A0L0HDD0_SPIPD|nr:uncharacterized protein SPPG_05938 [Spizellomyces punctatus DAOM BR117]KNC98984.1 hypothetical protein SPPG_05938 [Spizellomyces punctatus DAOM BR117]|eukprot:XP_016607024.1 hypothetical protein SPPG_05938 [Spizellomyces punctatus DAOM BR117]